MRKRLLIVPLIIFCALLFSFTPLARASAAHAIATSSPGNQLEVFVGGTYNSIAVYGYNPSGKYVSHCFAAPHTAVYTNGYYWQGTVVVYGYTNSTCSGTAITSASACVPYWAVGGYFLIDIFSDHSSC